MVSDAETVVAAPLNGVADADPRKSPQVRGIAAVEVPQLRPLQRQRVARAVRLGGTTFCDRAVLEPLIRGIKAKGWCFATLREHPAYRTAAERVR